MFAPQSGEASDASRRFQSVSICEGMWFVNGASWEHSGCNCRTDGNMVTIRTVGKLKPAGGLTGDARRFRFGDQSPSL
jgi:hypothetical protein